MCIRDSIVLVLSLVSMPARSAGTELQPGQVWKGTYVCSQGEATLELTITHAEDAGRNYSGQLIQDVGAVFAFKDTNSEGSFSMNGSFSPETKALVLDPGKWLKQPFFYSMVGLEGEMSADGMNLNGRVTKLRSCRNFQLTFDSSRGKRARKSRASSGSGGEVTTYRKNACRGLASWVKPLRREFPNVDFRRLKEDSAKKNYKYLFSDEHFSNCLLYTSPSPRDATLSRMPSSA